MLKNSDRDDVFQKHTRMCPSWRATDNVPMPHLGGAL
jgi:hypothetical protein